MSGKPERRINTSNMKNELEIVLKQQTRRNSSTPKVEPELTSEAENEDFNIRGSKKEQNSAHIIPEKPIRGFNVQECILIVFDRVKDEMETDFFDCGDKKIAPRNMMHRVLRMFIHNKLAISDKHCFAIMALNEGDCTLKMLKFIKNPASLDKMLQNISEGCNTEDVFNMNQVFECILEKHGGLIHYGKSPPDIVYRVIFCYGRSFTLPILNLTPEIKALLEAPNFFFDVVYTHEAPTTPSKHDQIFKCLQEYDRKDVGYLFRIERNLKAAHLAMAQLLAHPFQRHPLKSPIPYLSLNKKNEQIRVPASTVDEKEDSD